MVVSWKDDSLTYTIIFISANFFCVQCLFHSISTCLAYAENGTHIDLRDPENLQWLYENSARLRKLAVDCLEKKRNQLVFLQGNEHLKAQDLVEAAASQYGISGSEYCDLMRQDSYWGGGPEIVALCNVLRRPIHIYELHVQNNQFFLRRMACFGSPKFDGKQALHILSADSRFPDLTPGKQLTSGNHFLAMFPISQKKQRFSQKKQRLRGGDDHHHHRDNNDDSVFSLDLSEASKEKTLMEKIRRAYLNLKVKGGEIENFDIFSGEDF